MDDGEGREHGPTGPSTNANPPDIPPERQGGPEQSGCGSKRGPTASQNEALKGGIETAGETADRPQRDGGRNKQGDERCGRRRVFSQAHNKTGFLTSHQSGVIQAGNEAGKKRMYFAPWSKCRPSATASYAAYLKEKTDDSDKLFRIRGSRFSCAVFHLKTL